MQIHEIKEYRCSFDKKEVKVIMTCLDYCSHRICEHNKRISKPEGVDKLRKEIREFLELTKN